MSYKFLDWKCSRWETPISDAASVTMELSCIGGRLQIILDPSSLALPKPKTKITFGKSMAFRSLEESYMTALWGKFSDSDWPGKTFVVEQSPWIAELAEQDSLFSELCKNARHYVIASDMEVLEVISGYPPHIEGLN